MIKVFRKKSREQITYDGSSMDKAYAWSDLTSDAQSTTGTPPSMAYESSSYMYVAWVAVQLAANTAYTSNYGDMESVVELYNDSGVKVAQSEWDDMEWTLIPLSYTPTAAGTYYLKFRQYYFEQEYPPIFSFSPRAADPSRPQYTPWETSGGFDAWGRPVRYRSAGEAGILGRIPTGGLIFYAPLATNTDVKVGPAFTTTGTPVFGISDGIACGLYDNTRSIVKNADIIDSLGSSFTLSVCFKSSSSLLNCFGCGRDSDPGYHAAMLTEYDGYIGIERAMGHTLTDMQVLDGEWHHCCAVVNGANIDFYIDGDGHERKTLYSSISIDYGNIVVGGWVANNNYNCNAYLCAARIYNRALSADEVAKLAREFRPTA